MFKKIDLQCFIVGQGKTFYMPYLSTKNVFCRHNDVRRYDVALMQLKGSSTWRRDGWNNGNKSNDNPISTTIMPTLVIH